MRLRFLKRHPFYVLMGLLVAIQLVWFWISPTGFKAAWSRNPLVAEIIKEHSLANQKAKIMAISYYFPDFSYFSDIVAGRAQPRAELMDGYHFGKPYIFHMYYQLTANYFPDNDVAQYLLGFCDYYMEHMDKAKRHYEKSLAINPYFFWTYYNLGVIYFRQRDYYHSAVFLNKALSVRKEIALAMLSQSPFYRQIWHNLNDPPQILEGNLMTAQQDALLLMAACFVKAGAYDQALRVVQSVPGNGWHQGLRRQIRQQALSRQPLGGVLEGLLQKKIVVRLF
ncbi:MAG: hypothetical protein KGK03_01695 [Candidatus Omnitrophica bacterium]|nr:hypothetical protein [Candidatus Omnitrophota bacterium]